MPDNLVIRIDKVIPKEELQDKLPELLHLLQKNKQGFIIDSLRLRAPEIMQKEFNLPLITADLQFFKTQLQKFISSNFRLNVLDINIKEAPASFSMNYYAKTFEAWNSDSSFHCYIYYARESKSNYQKLIDFTLLAADFLKADFFIGGFEISADIWDMETSDGIWLLGAKSDYLPLLQKHVKTKFGLDLSTKELQKIVEQSADFIKKKNGFTVISFMQFTKDENVNLLYEKLKELKLKGTKI